MTGRRDSFGPVIFDLVYLCEFIERDKVVRKEPTVSNARDVTRARRKAGPSRVLSTTLAFSRAGGQPALTCHYESFKFKSAMKELTFTLSLDDHEDARVQAQESSQYCCPCAQLSV